MCWIFASEHCRSALHCDSLRLGRREWNPPDLDFEVAVVAGRLQVKFDQLNKLNDRQYVSAERSGNDTCIIF